MKAVNRRRFLGGLAAGATLGSAALASIVSDSAPSGEKSAGGIAAGDGSRFPNVVLRTHENQEVRFYDDLIKDKIVLINFMFTDCEDDCPLYTANLKGVQELLGERVGRDIFMYSITLDPDHDTPEVLERYARDFGAKPGWLFLTGAKGDIESLRKKFGLVDPDPVVDADREQHIGMIWYGIESLARWAGCPALTPPKWIARYIAWAEPNGERPSF